MSLPDPQARIVSLERELAWANLKIQSLMEELRQFRRKLLGPKSETLNDLQLELLADQEPGTTLDEVEAESQRAPLTTAPRRERKPHPGRRRLPENLERVEEVVPCAEQTCRQSRMRPRIRKHEQHASIRVRAERSGFCSSRRIQRLHSHLQLRVGCLSAQHEYPWNTVAIAK